MSAIITRAILTALYAPGKNSALGWAHCNFSEWHNMKYLGSFLQMNQLVRNMKLAPADETRVLDDLSKWEQNGNL
jgi:hypothetical protein